MAGPRDDIKKGHTVKIINFLLFTIALVGTFTTTLPGIDKEAAVRNAGVIQKFNDFIQKGQPAGISQDDWYTILQADNLLSSYKSEIEQLEKNLLAYKK